LTFVHPKYDAKQHLLFNKSNTTMIEIVKGEHQVKAMLYSKKSIDKNEDPLCEWKILRQLDHFPNELLDVSMYPYFFSPEFTYYIDYDPSSDQFIIRNS